MIKLQEGLFKVITILSSILLLTHCSANSVQKVNLSPGETKGSIIADHMPTPIMTGDNPGGRELVTALPLGGALGNLPGLGGYNDQLLDREIGNLKNEMSALRKDLEGYFGFGGTAAKQYARETTRGLESANNRV